MTSLFSINKCTAIYTHYVQCSHFYSTQLASPDIHKLYFHSTPLESYHCYTVTFVSTLHISKLSSPCYTQQFPFCSSVNYQCHTSASYQSYTVKKNSFHSCKLLNAIHNNRHFSVHLGIVILATHSYFNFPILLCTNCTNFFHFPHIAGSRIPALSVTGHANPELGLQIPEETHSFVIVIGNPLPTRTQLPTSYFVPNAIEIGHTVHIPQFHPSASRQ